MSEKQRKWQRIIIYYDDGSQFYLEREELQRINQIQDILDAIAIAKEVKQRLERLPI